jgi:hypothetical protein
MKYYNSIIADKLACITEIQSTYRLIDAAKKENRDPSEHLEVLEKLKASLELLNIRILTYKLNVLASGSPPDPTEPGLGETFFSPEADFQDESADGLAGNLNHEPPGNA